jgi:hypothetical protein
VTDGDRPGSWAGIDTSVPHSARIWNYWLGGKDNYEVDRMAGDQFTAMDPSITVIARQTRGFLQRVVTYLAGEVRLRQFIDVGTGLPTEDNTHDVAQRIAPEARIVYVDNDPLVLAHARALLTSTPQGATRYVDADMADPDRILAGAAEILDLNEPVGLLFMGVLGHVGDVEQARTIVRRLTERLAPGSYFALCDGVLTGDFDITAQAQDEYNDSGAIPYHMRPIEQVRSYFDGLDMVEPGFVSITRWRPRAVDVGTVGELPSYGAVGRVG